MSLLDKSLHGTWDLDAPLEAQAPVRRAATAAGLAPLAQRYVLVLHIPVYKDPQGRRWLDPLWHKDLLEHAVYLSDFTLACPCKEVAAPPAGFVEVDDPRITFCDLPGRRKLTLNLPRTLARLWRSIGRAEVVHTGLGGWLPISLHNLASLMARLRGRFLMVIVESSPWRLTPGQPASLQQRVLAALSEWVNRRTLRAVDLAIFTQGKYKQSLLTGRPGRGHVIHASWIDEAVIASDAEAAASWQAKQAEPLRLLFAGRLTAAKGVPVLLEALRRADREGVAMTLRVVGQGEGLDACRAINAELSHVRVEVLDPVPYGPAFFRLVREHHAVVVPSITDEQPRIVYDAYSQAVPVLASDTDGLRDCVFDGATGRLCPANDAAALASLLAWAAAAPAQLRAMSASCLDHAHRMTHQEMHRRRWKLLDDVLRQRVSAG
jgi:glycosyltransferase involved in cell wall biosynthesis